MKITLKVILTLNTFLLATAILTGCRDLGVLKKQNTETVIYNTDSTTVKFKGIVTAVKNDCWADGTCSIEVNNEWWIEIAYGLRDPNSIPKERGQSKGVRFTKDNESIGKKVKVYAEIIDDNKLTLEGDNVYYVEIIETKI